MALAVVLGVAMLASIDAIKVNGDDAGCLRRGRFAGGRQHRAAQYARLWSARQQAMQTAD